MIVYKVTNQTNGKIYIGQTTQSLSKRKKNHRDDVVSGQMKCPLLHNAMKKYGFENFVFESIDKAQNIDELNDLEMHYIKQFNSLVPNGYNLAIGGRNCSPTEETRKKQSDAKKGRKLSAEHKNKISASRTEKDIQKKLKKLFLNLLKQEVIQKKLRKNCL